ncbi:hypothetical protein Goari_019795, partial [Gossypium aridum]|nr:hypothetical protein [Gossypium aridum]
RFLTNLERISRGLGQSSSCGNCCHETEDIFHVLQDCVAVKDLWKHVIPSDQQNRFFSDNFQIWFSSNLCCHVRLQELGVASQNVSKPLSPNPYHKRHIEEMWVHLFSKGVVERDSGKATAGGVIQDIGGNWILGFSHYLGNCTPFEAELWGILDGILRWRIQVSQFLEGYKGFCVPKSSLQTFDKPPDEVLGVLQQYIACDIVDLLI